jgi:hypothetical protein
MTEAARGNLPLGFVTGYFGSSGGPRVRKSLSLESRPYPAVEAGKWEGHRLDSRQRESSINQLLRAESNLFRCPQVEEMHNMRSIFDFLAEDAKNADWLAGRQSFEPPSPFHGSGCPQVSVGQLTSIRGWIATGRSSVAVSVAIRMGKISSIRYAGIAGRSVRTSLRIPSRKTAAGCRE